MGVLLLVPGQVAGVCPDQMEELEGNVRCALTRVELWREEGRGGEGRGGRGGKGDKEEKEWGGGREKGREFTSKEVIQPRFVVVN